MDNCIFCKILKGEIPSYKIYEDKFTYAFLDISNDGNGHVLVIPKEHFTNLLDVSDEALCHVMKTVKLVGKHLVDNCGFDGYNIINANDASAGQSVFHLHIHILPRKNGDNLNCFPTWYKNPMSMEETYKKFKIN